MIIHNKQNIKINNKQNNRKYLQINSQENVNNLSLALKI